MDNKVDHRHKRDWYTLALDLFVKYLVFGFLSVMAYLLIIQNWIESPYGNPIDRDSHIILDPVFQQYTHVFLLFDTSHKLDECPIVSPHLYH